MDEQNKRSLTVVEVEKALNGLADVVVTALKESEQNDQDPFERYAHQVRLHLYQQIEDFGRYVQEGYHILIDELDQGSTKG